MERLANIISKEIYNTLIVLADKEDIVKYCEHYKYCSRPKYSMKCIFNSNGCKVKPFYDKYGNYNEMFIGSRI